MEISRQADMESTIRRFEKRLEISRFAVEWLYKLAFDAEKKNVSDKAIQFSIVELLNRIKSSSQSLLVDLMTFNWKTWRKHFYIYRKSVR